MGNCCCCFCPWTKPRKYLYKLSKKQNKIIQFYCNSFCDVKYLVKQPISFTLNNKHYKVNQGFACDGVSSGCFLSNLIGVNTAIMHDFLYATHPDTKDICDIILKPSYRRTVVGIFGQSAWESSGQRGALVINQIPLSKTSKSPNQVTLTIYRASDYSVIDQVINLSELESKEFESYFKMVQ